MGSKNSESGPVAVSVIEKINREIFWPQGRPEASAHEGVSHVLCRAILDLFREVEALEGRIRTLERKEGKR